MNASIELRDGLVRWLLKRLEEYQWELMRMAPLSPAADLTVLLADIEARQEIIRLHHFQRDHRWDYENRIGWRCRQCDTEYPCQTLRLLAWPLRAEPGYLKEWAWKR